jgi:hypothetical protein
VLFYNNFVSHAIKINTNNICFLNKLKLVSLVAATARKKGA